MESKTSYENILEIFLITFNRSACLDNTLNQLKDSPFARCRFTVLDNCSTDDTPQIIAKYKDDFPRYRIIRHIRNIGGDNNYLRAVELSTALYTWIICDDDNYDFTHVSEVIAAIESCNYDLIYVASRSETQLRWKRSGGTTVKELINDGAWYHRGCTFWPSLIFKSAQFDNCCYINAPYLFPSVEFINKTIRDDLPIFVSEQETVIRFDGSVMEVTPLYQFKEWVENSVSAGDNKTRSMIIEQFTVKGFIASLVFWIALEKALHRAGYLKRLVDIFFALTPKLRLKYLLMLPVMVIPIPKSVLLAARKFVYGIIGDNNVQNLPPIDYADISSSSPMDTTVSQHSEQDRPV